MERKLISEEELLSILNSQLSKYEECKDCRFDTPPLKLVELDKDGCNWSTINMRCSGIPPEISKICRSFAERIVFEARKKYNIKNNMAKET